MAAQRYVQDILQPHVFLSWRLPRGSRIMFGRTHKGVTESPHNIVTGARFITNRTCMGQLQQPTSVHIASMPLYHILYAS
ncbi:hypothetical protein GDO78_022197 [Eleutherodactylus coqui]|uniref:Uncharacterized protein n=1 Tax=Eleutherodactylus coqui TaxID=57060 RepID=A0A8J6EGA8_ELECQ|nr:hypothetical protein GDO78_022197 [Eleutherodactylus coqui]